MIQEIAVADMQPSVKTCFPLLESLQNICLLHGNDISYYRLVFQTVENIITKTTKDDISGYLLFLEDVFPYMEKYHEENGMQRILRELSSLLEDTTLHSKFAAKLLYILLVRIRSRSAQAVVHMAHFYLETELFPQTAERQKQAYRIRSARYACYHNISMFDHMKLYDQFLY